MDPSRGCSIFQRENPEHGSLKRGSVGEDFEEFSCSGDKELERDRCELILDDLQAEHDTRLSLSYRSLSRRRPLIAVGKRVESFSDLPHS